VIPVRGQYLGQSYRLYNDYNDVHVFVEDAGFENLYKEIFRVYGLRIRQVFSKNGKKAVIDAARSCTDNRCVYIVDRDWDDILNRIESLENVVVLQKHSIENYLLDYSGFYAIVLADNPRADMDALFNELVFNSIVNKISNRLRPLFESYLAMQITEDDRQGCSQKPGSFQEKNRTCAPDRDAIARFIADIGIPIPQSVRNYFAGDVLRDRGHGKYMLHFLWVGVCKSTHMRQLEIDRLMVRLAQVIDPSVFTTLCDEVLKKGSLSS
jgi:hypothetical protein